MEREMRSEQAGDLDHEICMYVCMLCQWRQRRRYQFVFVNRPGLGAVLVQGLAYTETLRYGQTEERTSNKKTKLEHMFVK